MLTLNDGRSELWQWDTGRKLTVDADCSQVHFSNKIFGRSIDVDVVDGVAIIPDVLLQTDKDLNVWAFVGTAENGYTKISKTFKVNRRNKPSDYVFTPPDQTTLGELVERLDKIEESQDPDAIKNAVEDYLEQNPVESPVQSVNGYNGKVELTAEDVGAISQDDLQEATNKALAQAKASGEFDGADGQPGKDGISATHSWNGTILTVTSESGTSSADLKGEKGDTGEQGPQGIQGIQGIPGEKGEKGDTGAPGADGEKGDKGDKGDTGATGAQGEPGKDGQDGRDGTSVTVKSVSESTVDGGSNIVTFSDGKTLTVKNGGKGSKGDKGDKGDTGPEGPQGPKGDKGETGATGATGPEGPKGDTGTTGQRGTGILKITTAPSSYTTATGGFTPTYRVALSTVLSQAKVTEVLVGDTVGYSYYHYPVGYVDSSYVYLGTRVSIRGETGAAGDDGKTPVKGTDYWTSSDKTEMVNSVLAALPTWTGGNY